jgi:hypothetical protein
MNDDELIRQIESEETQALGYFSGDLSRERERGIEYYHGTLEQKFAAPEGRSEIVSTDVRDAVDGMLPDLLDVFLSSDDVVKFEPQGPEDEDAAKQATDAVNYVFYRQNPGALILYEWFKSALMEKNGVVKFYHEKYATPQFEKYDGLDDIQFQMLIAQPGVTVMQHSGHEDPAIQGGTLHDVQVRIIDPTGKICVEGLPSEEFLVSWDHRSLCLDKVRFAEHRRKMTISDIRSMGIDVDPDESDDPLPAEFSPEWQARRRYQEERDFGQKQVSDPSLKQLTVCDISMLADFDGDGYAERRKVIKIGKRAYFNEYSDHVPFAAICPNIMPFRFFGLSIADVVADIQLLKTGMWRGAMDSLSFALRPRIGVMESMVNLDDLLVSRPGGVVRFKTNPNMAWSPIEHRFVGQAALPMIEYADSVKENRTGFTRYSQGLDADSLNKTASGMAMITSASAKRQKLIARMFAETGMKDLFRGIMGLIQKHNPKPMSIRLRNNWVEVDPRQWKTSWDMTVNVGLGTGDKAQQAAHISQIIGVQKGLREAGMSHMVTDQNIYNGVKRLQETAGYKQEGEFFTPPGPTNPPPQMPPPPEVLKIQADSQTKQAEIASDEKLKLADYQHGLAVADIQKETSIAVAQIKAAADIQMKKMDQEHTASLEIFKAGAQKDAQNQKLAHDAEMKKPNGEDKSAITQLLQANTKALTDLAKAINGLR